MFGSWFTKNGNDKQNESSTQRAGLPNDKARENESFLHKHREHNHWIFGHRQGGESSRSHEPPEPPQPTPEPPETDYFIPRGFRTEHDAALTNLGVEQPAHGFQGEDIITLSVEPPVETDPSHKSPHDADTSHEVRTISSDPYYDPFSGHLFGTISPRSSYFSPSESGETEAPAAQAFDAAREALWSHLSRIRTLQAQIAETHVQLDGADGPGGWPGEPFTGSTNGTGIGGIGARRVSSTVGGVRAGRGSGEWGEDEYADEDAERRREREAELSALESRFARRQEAVDTVMVKLDELSQALTAFHALEMPEHPFPRSTSPIDGSTISGIPRDGSPSLASTLLHGGVPSTSGRFSAPGPHFDSSPAMPKRVLTPDFLTPSSHPHSPLSGSQTFPIKGSLLIEEEPEGNEK